jgi:hypothetical protein
VPQSLGLNTVLPAEQMILVDVTYPCPKNSFVLQGILKVALQHEIE